MSDLLPCSVVCVFKEETYTTLEEKPLSSHCCLTPYHTVNYLRSKSCQLTAVAQKGKHEGYWNVLNKSKWSVLATNSNQKSAESCSYKDFLLGTDPKQNFL